MKKIFFIFLLASVLAFGKDPVVVLETNKGTVELRLFKEIAPKACENFTRLVQSGYYNGVIFHRVIKDFMIQTGDPTGTGRGGSSIWGKPFEDECKPNIIFDRPYLLAMANAGRNTNGSQFFITTVKTPWLNGFHTIFGEVISGFDAVKKIEANPTQRSADFAFDKIIKAYVK